MLEVDLNRKSTIAIKLGSLNFVDPSSLMTWMEMRQMIFDVGKRFFIRLEGDIIAFTICVIIELVFVLLRLNKIYNAEPLFDTPHYFLIGIHLVTLGLYNARTLIVAAYINDETDN